jgi:hypothetical protein
MYGFIAIWMDYPLAMKQDFLYRKECSLHSTGNTRQLQATTTNGRSGQSITSTHPLRPTVVVSEMRDAEARESVAI